MEAPRHWRLNKQRYLLKGDSCPQCEINHFPPRQICPDCGGNVSEVQKKNSQIEIMIRKREIVLVAVNVDSD